MFSTQTSERTDILGNVTKYASTRPRLTPQSWAALKVLIIELRLNYNVTITEYRIPECPNTHKEYVNPGGPGARAEPCHGMAFWANLDTAKGLLTLVPGLSCSETTAAK